MSLFQSITVIFSAANDAAPTSHTTRTPYGPTSGPPRNPSPNQSSTNDDLGVPVYFYESDKPYYESDNLSVLLILGSLIYFSRFTSFSDHPVEYHGRFYRTAEHRRPSFRGKRL